MPHSLNNHQSLKKEQEESEAQHGVSGWQKDARFSLVTCKGYYFKKFLLQGTKFGPRQESKAGFLHIQEAT